MALVPRFPVALLALLSFAACAGFAAEASPADAGAKVPVQGLCDALITAMKKGASMDFSARQAMLAPEIERDLDLPLMTRIVVGPSWRSLSASDQRGLVDAFSNYSITTYVQRFKSYGGEHFEVDPTPSALAGGDCVVHTKLFTGDPNPVQLDYRMRKAGSVWKIIDVFLSGTISEMAARRSEYSATLRQDGASGLIALLQKKAAALRG